MTYRAGLGPGMERYGLTPGPPHVFCDGSGCTRRVDADGEMPPAWLRDGKAPKGWLLVRMPDESRRDYCPVCRKDIEKVAT